MYPKNGWCAVWRTIEQSTPACLWPVISVSERRTFSLIMFLMLAGFENERGSERRRWAFEESEDGGLLSLSLSLFIRKVHHRRRLFVIVQTIISLLHLLFLLFLCDTRTTVIRCVDIIEGEKKTKKLRGWTFSATSIDVWRKNIYPCDVGRFASPNVLVVAQVMKSRSRPYQRLCYEVFTMSTVSLIR